MKTKIHAIAGGIAFLTILTFWISTLFTELFTSYETVAMIKGMILKGMFLLIPAMVIVGASGMSLGSKRQDALALGKKRRMPIIAMTGILILLPAAFYLEMKASSGVFDTWFYVAQAIELIAGASNLRLMALNIRDGLRMTGKIGGGANSHSGESQSYSIKAQENGALLVQGNPEIKGAENNVIATKKVTSLCRCGASNTKPFCDGSHNKIGFNDQLSSDRTKDETTLYAGKEINIHYNKLLCSHAGECGQLKSVFDPKRDPWIISDNGTVESIKNIVKACPSGALSCSHKNQEPQQLTSNEVGVKIEKSGPYIVKGIPIENASIAKGACAEKYVLCRCGASKNKPYCDGSHVNIAWKDD